MLQRTNNVGAICDRPQNHSPARSTSNVGAICDRPQNQSLARSTSNVGANCIRPHNTDYDKEVNMELPQRKKIRLSNYDYNSVGAYFVTICTKDKYPYLWDRVEDLNDIDDIVISDAGKVVENEIYHLNSVYPYVSVDNYCIMSDHIHLIISITQGDKDQIEANPTLSRIVKQFKSTVTKQIGYSIWQKSFYEHIIRNDEEYQQIWRYTDDNPAKYIYQ